MRPFHATNEPNTCLWCGHKLIDNGYYGEGLFCTLRCGFQFGTVLATNGQRFEPKDIPPPVRRTRYVYPHGCPECHADVTLKQSNSSLDYPFVCPACHTHFYEYDKTTDEHETPSGSVTVTTFQILTAPKETE